MKGRSLLNDVGGLVHLVRQARDEGSTEAASYGAGQALLCKLALHAGFLFDGFTMGGALFGIHVASKLSGRREILSLDRRVGKRVESSLGGWAEFTERRVEFVLPSCVVVPAIEVRTVIARKNVLLDLRLRIVTGGGVEHWEASEC
jgi:hypothetical protein